MTIKHSSSPEGKTIKSPSKKVILSDNNMDTLGFARFYYPSDKVKIHKEWERKIIPGIIDPEGINIDNILIPEEFLFPLSNKAGALLVNNNRFFIDSIGRDIRPMNLLSQRAGWNQTGEDLNTYMDIPKTGNFIAGMHLEGTKIPLGCGAVLPVNEDHCWISMVLVHLEVRRQGIARALMRHCMKYAENELNDPIVGLDASEMGLPLYESMGFDRSFLIWRCLIPTRQEIRSHPGTQIQSVSEFEELEHYFANRKFEHKIKIYKKLTELKESWNYFVSSENQVSGFVLSRPGRRYPYIGPLVADNDEIASILLSKALRKWHKKGFREIFMDIPENHFAEAGKIGIGSTGQAEVVFPRKHKFLDLVQPVRGFVRMYHMTAGTVQRIHDFIRREKDQLLSYFHGIGGPEWS